MSRSIIEQKNAKECYICGSTVNLEVHHIIYGRGRRNKSEHYGLKVHLCHNCHHENIHKHPNKESDLGLKQIAQTEFERVYSHKLFMDEFGKNYLR